MPRQPRAAVDSIHHLPSEEALVSATDAVLGPDVLRRVVLEAQRYRKRKLSVEVIAVAMTSFVMGRFASLRDLLDRLSEGRIKALLPIKVAPSSFYERLGTLSHDVARQLLVVVSDELGKQQQHTFKGVAKLAPFASGIYAIDDTTLDKLVRNTKELRDAAQGAMVTLAGRLACALDLVTGRFAEVMFDRDAGANERTHLFPLVEKLGPGGLFVFDLGYTSFALFDGLTDRFCHFVTRMPNKVTYETLRVLRDGPRYRDSIIELGVHRADRARHPVRLVELLIDGRWFRYLTNVTSPSLLPAHHVWGLYFHRWAIEHSFSVLKRCLSLAYIRASNPNAVLWQLWCTLLIFQVLQFLRLQIAAKAGWHPDEVSWEMLVRRIAWYAEDNPTQPLLQWLLERIDNLNLKKRGVRQHRPTALPKELLAEIRRKVGEPDDDIPTRLPRYGHAKPSKAQQYRVTASLKH